MGRAGKEKEGAEKQQVCREEALNPIFFIHSQIKEREKQIAVLQISDREGPAFYQMGPTTPALASSSVKQNPQSEIGRKSLCELK